MFNNVKLKYKKVWLINETDKSVPIYK